MLGSRVRAPEGVRKRKMKVFRFFVVYPPCTHACGGDVAIRVAACRKVHSIGSIHAYPNGGCHKSENWQNYLRGGPTHRFIGNLEVLSYSKQTLLQIVPLPYSEAIDPDDNMSKVLYSGPRSKPYGRKPLARFQPPQRVKRHRLSDATFKEISQVLFH